MGYTPYRNDPVSDHDRKPVVSDPDRVPDSVHYVIWGGANHIFRPEQIMKVVYTNHEGQTGWRTIVPLPTAPVYGSLYHPAEWCIRVWDFDKNAERTYAISGILYTISLVAYNLMTDYDRALHLEKVR